jgi:hypothetical protein
MILRRIGPYPKHQADQNTAAAARGSVRRVTSEERQKQLDEELPRLQAEIDFFRISSFSPPPPPDLPPDDLMPIAPRCSRIAGFVKLSAARPQRAHRAFAAIAALTAADLHWQRSLRRIQGRRYGYRRVARRAGNAPHTKSRRLGSR